MLLHCARGNSGPCHSMAVLSVEEVPFTDTFSGLQRFTEARA